ncbi:MAG TPA: Maf family protein [Nitrospira sp.]
MRVILASTSPRRRDLLSLLEIHFEVVTPSFEERIVPGHTAKELVAQFARGKATSVAQHNLEALVIASDTLIQLNGEVLGKPDDLPEARAILRRMAGRAHLVQTAVACCCAARRWELTEVATASVWMKPFDAETHERYLATGDSLGKAGAYSIQGPGGELIERLDGDFTAVVGLPLRLVANLLARGGVMIPVDVDALYVSRPYGNWVRFGG